VSAVEVDDVAQPIANGLIELALSTIPAGSFCTASV
jgi:hypothetical protein